MRSLVRWASPMKFVATSGSGHTVLMDGPPDHGGEDSGPRPMEMLLMGLGGCASFDVVHILKRSREDVTGCEAEITAERADEEPKVFTAIHLHFVVTGKGLREKNVAKAIKLSSEKYCSASIMLGKTAEVTHDYEVIEAE